MHVYIRTVTKNCMLKTVNIHIYKGCEGHLLWKAVKFYSKTKKQSEYPTQYNTEKLELWIAVNISSYKQSEL